MTITIDPSVLTAYYNARAGVGAATSRASGGGKAPAKTPTPPWSLDSTAPRANALAKAVLNGARFVNPSAAKLDVATAPEDYRKLFALYQGLNALQGLAEQASSKGISEGEKTRIRQRFAEGMAEISKYIDEARFDKFNLAQGQVAAKLTSNAGVKVETNTYQTATLWSGPVTGLPPAFQGDVAFSLSVKKGAATTNVAFDLSEMGATPRTMSNVVIYMNDKLAAAGVTTRFQNERIPGGDKTTTVGGKTVVLGNEPDSYALKIKGDSTEVLTFSAAATAPSVYLAGASGRDTDKLDPTLQLTKLEAGAADVAGAGANGKLFAKGFDPGVSAVKAQVTAPDGSTYVLAEVDGEVDGQAIKGASDVALMKYDAAGALVYTRTLGAASNASGYALAVSADGSQVAVAGSVTGVLDQGDAGSDAKLADSFVTVFDAAGEEAWTQRSGAAAADRATGVAFAADGSVYVTGVAASAMPGASAVGGEDGYLRGYSATGALKFTTQFGTGGADRPVGLVVDGNSVVVAGMESNEAVLRRYDLQPSGAPTLAATRSLGALNGGELAGVGLLADGSLVVAGATSNGALSVGGATSGYPGQKAAFVARLAGDLSAGADRLTYLAGSTARTATAMTVSGGQVYVAGQVTVTPPPGETSAHDGYVQAIDPETGAVSWSRQLQGADKAQSISSISVDAGGASVLDRLGLPQGQIDFGVSKTVAANSSVRVGDQFVVKGGAGSKTVTVEAGDTLKTLGEKIARASGFTVKVETTTVDGVQKLKLTPISKQQVEIEAGRAGRNALAALGLNEGLVTNAPTTAADAKKAKTDVTYGLNLPSTLSLDSEAQAKQASSLLINAAMALKDIYTALITPQARTNTQTGGTVPTYLKNQISNYQLALARLGG